VYYWFRVGRNYGVKHRGKGGTNWNYHVSGSLVGIPEQGATWVWSCRAGVLDLHVNGERCDKYPLAVSGARLRRITISHWPDRPIGCEWQAGEVEEGGE